MPNAQPEQPPAAVQSLMTEIGHIAGIIASDNFSTSDRAMLKRMDLNRMPPLAFYRFAVRHLPHNWQAEHRTWQTLLTGMALMSPQIHRPDLPLGKVLAESRYSEAWLERLLSAEGVLLLTLSLRAVRFLAAKKLAVVNWLDIANLLLSRAADKQEADACVSPATFTSINRKRSDRNVSANPYPDLFPCQSAQPGRCGTGQTHPVWRCGPFAGFFPLSEETLER